MVPTLDYLLHRQISPQWRGLLTALAEEFEAQIGQDELRQLMYRVGCRFALAHPLPPCNSTDDLALALNARWQETDWGYVELVDPFVCAVARVRLCCAQLDAGFPRRRVPDVAQCIGCRRTVGRPGERVR
jgi:hypothetical protein